MALEKLHKYALELNEQRVKDGKEWLQDNSDCGFYLGSGFHELSKSECYTRLYGFITEIELFTVVAVACRHDAVENDDGNLDDDYVETYFHFGDQQIEVRHYVADLISRLGL